MNRRFLLAAGLAALATPTLTTGARAIESTAGLQVNEHGWRPAAAPAGAVGWDVLASTRGVNKDVGGFTMLAPVFLAAVRALNGRTVRVPGYMYPMSTTPRQTRYLLMAYPPSCPFCLEIGPAYFVEVRPSAPEATTQDAILVEGKLTLLQEDADNLFYRLADARRV